MLIAEDIRSIVSSGEGYNAEFKVRVPAKVKSITEEVCAFANAAGGVLLIGVDDDNVIHGTSIDNAKRSAIQSALHEINPSIHCPLYSVLVDGKEVWVIEVVSGTQKPYAFAGAIFVRQGSNTQKITSVEQMRNFFQQADRIYFDETPCGDFDIENELETDFFEEFRSLANLSTHVSHTQIINNLKLTSAEGHFKNGAVLFFGKAPEAFFEKAVVRCVAFEGTDKVQIIDDKVFGGPLMHQYKQAMHWLKSKLDVRYEIKGGGPRIEKWEIPEIAFKETIVNSLSHRDYYDKGGRITIELFDDRVEITNPGGLVGVIKPSDFGTKSHSRNPLVFGLFERIDMVEQIGSGIKRIQNELKANNIPAAEFRTEGLFTVIFQRIKSGVKSGAENETKLGDWLGDKLGSKLGDTRAKIIYQIQKNKNITTYQLADKLGITEKGIEYHLNILRKDKILTRVGSKKVGYWKLEIEIENDSEKN